MNHQEKGRKSIALNNIGVSYINAKNYINAIKALRSALKGYQKVLNAIEQIQHGPKEMQEDTKDLEEEIFHLDCWMSQRSSSEHGSYQNNKSSSKLSSEFISFRTIVIPEIVPHSKAHMASLAIMYNLGLAYHLYGIQNNNDEEILRYSAALYDFVLDYRLSADAQISTCMVFTMSCLHNLGQLYRALGDKAMETFFFEKLLSFLMCMVDMFPSDERPSDIDDFVRSTMHLILPIQVVAAAA